LKAGDLVTIRTGNAGITAVVPESLNRTQCFTLLISTLVRGHLPAFYSHFLNSDAATRYFSLQSWGTAQRNISVPILKNVFVVVPPIMEQAAIVEHVGAETERLDKLSVSITTQIDKLREYRQTLISAAVTGKILVNKEDHR
jgi:type I restriction enzyme S subunit